MQDAITFTPMISVYHQAWSELTLLSIALGSILAITTQGMPLAGPSRPANDDWLRAYC